jgi:hypothetical protein
MTGGESLRRVAIHDGNSIELVEQRKAYSGGLSR